MRTRRAKPRIHEVASASHVSVATVSRVLNGKDGVTEPVRRRVLEAVDRLSYKPLRQAKAVAEVDTDAQAALRPVAYVSRSALPGEQSWAPAFAAASRRFQAASRALVMHFADQAPAAASPVLGGFSGVLAVNRESVAWAQAAHAAGLPTVLMGHAPLPLAVPQVVGDSFLGALRVMEHLIRRGHRRIAIWRTHVTADPRDPQRPLNEREKYAAYRLALDEAGIEFRPEYEINMPFQWEAIIPRAQALLKVAPAPTALFVDNDWTTSIFMRIPNGWEVLPYGWYQQYELAHFIDTGKDPAQYGLACACQAMDRIGELAAEWLLRAERVAGQDAPVFKVVPRFHTAEEAGAIRPRG
jgi:LacI family transcriptional regulator